MIPDLASRLQERLMHPQLGLGLGLHLQAGGAGGPALLLDFTTSAVLDSRITFTRASSATRVNASGLIETVSSNVARFNYDPLTLALLGLLVEDQRSNLSLFSEQIDNAVWAKVRSTVAANAGTAPDGASTADKLVEDTTASDNHFVRQTVTLSAGVHTRSVYLKASGRSWARLIIGGLGSCYFDLTNGATGTLTGTGSPSASIVNAGNGWWRCILTATATAATYDCNTLAATGNGGDVYTGNGSSGILIWGEQMEAGAFATSYIPTTSAQVTRAADAPVVDISAILNASEGAIVVRGDLPKSDNGVMVSADSGADTERLDIYRASSSRLNGRCTAGGVVQADIQSQALTGTRKAAALAYKANDFAFGADAGTIGSDTSGSVPTGLTTLRLGHLRGPTAASNGHVTALSIYRRRPLNAELQPLIA